MFKVVIDHCLMASIPRQDLHGGVMTIVRVGFVFSTAKRNGIVNAKIFSGVCFSSRADIDNTVHRMMLLNRDHFDRSSRDSIVDNGISVGDN